MSKTAFVFPGQGAQTVGMGKDVAEASAAARAIFDRANTILGFDLAAICFEGPADRLNATDISQPAIFVTSVAIWAALDESGMLGGFGSPAAMAGLSLGEYTALHLGGWLNFEDALRLVAERGRLMQGAANSTAGGMVSIMGIDEAATTQLCNEAAQGQVLGCANFNCPGQIVISGDKAACDRAVALADKFAAKAIVLTVAGAFHSDLMAPAVTGLEAALKSAKISQGQFPVVSNVSADYYDAPDTIRSLLRQQVAKPIRWQASIERLVRDGCDLFAEVGPGRVLTGLMRKIDRTVKAANYSTAAALEKVSV